jgi:hypothetical protein
MKEFFSLAYFAGDTVISLPSHLIINIDAALKVPTNSTVVSIIHYPIVVTSVGYIVPAITRWYSNKQPC